MASTDKMDPPPASVSALGAAFDALPMADDSLSSSEPSWREEIILLDTNGVHPHEERGHRWENAVATVLSAPAPSSLESYYTVPPSQQI